MLGKANENNLMEYSTFIKNNKIIDLYFNKIKQ